LTNYSIEPRSLNIDAKKAKKVEPKYRGPNGETWSGRGAKPRWLTIAISEGKQLHDFLIDAPRHC
jgi:DNA-binding protein H-NS